MPDLPGRWPMTCSVHVWQANSNSTLDLWAWCVNCGMDRWDPYRKPHVTYTPEGPR